MNYEQARPIVFAKSNEGGYLSAADAAKNKDSGGETYRGIARNKEPNWVGWGILDQIKREKGGYLPWNYTDARIDTYVWPFYRQKYWDKIQLDNFPAAMRLSVFDMYVNAGMNAFGVLSEAAGLPWKNNYTNTANGRNDSNIVSANIPGMIELAKKITPSDYEKARVAYYTRIATAKGMPPNVLDTWKRRAAHIRDEATKFITENPGATIGVVIGVGTLFFLGYKAFFDNKKRGKR